MSDLMQTPNRAQTLEIRIACETQSFDVEVKHMDDNFVVLGTANELDALRAGYLYRSFLSVEIVPDVFAPGRFIMTADDRPF